MLVGFYILPAFIYSKQVKVKLSTFQNLVDAIQISTLSIPLCFRRAKRHRLLIHSHLPPDPTLKDFRASDVRLYIVNRGIGAGGGGGGWGSQKIWRSCDGNEI